MHAEFGTVSSEAAAALNAARAGGGRIIAVGTTSLRLLESAAGEDGTIAPFAGETDIFITPGYRFRAADALMTNFHLPRSTLFMLVCAFAGLDAMKAAYAHAIAAGYRFYSYGDACLLFRSDRDRRERGRPGRSAAQSRAGCLPGRDARGELMAEQFTFSVAKTDGLARTGEIRMPRGVVRTPAFMPVGTAGTVKAMYADQVKAAGADIVLGNTYHLMLRPGAERLAALGGLHQFMNWPYPILTDSGGFLRRQQALERPPVDRADRPDQPADLRRVRLRDRPAAVLLDRARARARGAVRELPAARLAARPRLDRAARGRGRRRQHGRAARQDQAALVRRRRRVRRHLGRVPRALLHQRQREPVPVRASRSSSSRWSSSAGSAASGGWCSALSRSASSTTG